MQQYEEEELRVYFYDTGKHKWTICPTFAAYADNGSSRLTCRIKAYGVYRLALK